ncbi:MAG: hypothetical protein RLZZ08_1334 [Pseudomonadota bacterium]|jgi:hypothetical protein
MTSTMNQPITTSRRSFLKSGALVAAPLAAVAAVPVAALGVDGSASRLARLEDERAIEGLHRQVLQKLNGEGDCTSLRIAADAVQIDPALRAIAEQPGAERVIEFADGGHAASTRHLCRVELDSHFSGDSTLEKMARFQGHGSHQRAENRVLQTDYVKGKDGWKIARLALA